MRPSPRGAGLVLSLLFVLMAPPSSVAQRLDARFTDLEPPPRAHFVHHANVLEGPVFTEGPLVSTTPPLPERPPFGAMAVWGSVGSLAGVGIGWGITSMVLGDPADDYGAGMMLFQLGGGLSILGNTLGVWGSGKESGVGFGHAFLSSLFGFLPAAVSGSSSAYAYPVVHGFLSAGLATWMASNRGPHEPGSSRDTSRIRESHPRPGTQEH